IATIDLLRREPKALAEHPIRGSQTASRVEDGDGLANRVDDRAEVVAGMLDEGLVALAGVDIDDAQHGAIEPVIHALVRPDADREPPPRPVLHLAFARRDGVDRLADQLLEVVAGEVRIDLADRPPDVARDQIEQLLRPRRKSPDAQIASDDDD